MPHQSTNARSTTPVHLGSSTTQRFDPSYANRDMLFATMAAEMSPYFIGPMPIPSSTPGSVVPSFHMGLFKTPLSDFPSLISPDFSIFKKEGNCKAETQVEFTVEYKSSYDEDPFVKESPSSSTSPSPAKHNPLMNSSMNKGCKTAGQITTYAASQLSAQYRTHVFSILIVHDYARFIRWDRSGAIFTAPVKYNESAELFEFFIRYNSANPSVRGCDETVRLASPSEAALARSLTALSGVKHFLVVSVPGDDNISHSYVIEAPTAIPYPPPGRGTSIAYDLARGKGVFFKDSWRVALDGIEKEGDIYRLFQQNSVPNVPLCSASGDIGEECFHQTQTQNFLNQPWCPNFHFQFIPHQHHRLILDDIGKPLEKFECSFDMVQAIYAALRAHDAAHQLGVLHRDISASNILIMKQSNFEDGALIDWDLCKLVKNKGQDSARQSTRTGTWQFMAADLILDPTMVHSFVHDLESAFFVLLWQSILYLPNSWSPEYRSSIIHTVFCPQVFWNTGGPGKVNFLLSEDVISPRLTITNNGWLTSLLKELRKVLAVRYFKRPEPKVKSDPFSLDVLEEPESETSSSGSSSKDERDNFYVLSAEKYDKALSYLKDHSAILRLFMKALANKDDWPKNDAANRQPF